YNVEGQLGIGTTDDVDTPVTVTGLNAVEISGGELFTCAVLSDGSVKCWGYNHYGMVGSSAVVVLPITAQGLTLNKVMDVSIGNNHGCALWDTGSVKCWGDNSSGQLGNGTTTSSTVPVDVTGITTATSIAVGDQYTCARLSDSTLRC